MQLYHECALFGMMMIDYCLLMLIGRQTKQHQHKLRATYKDAVETGGICNAKQMPIL
jgi:hypothetical protein